MKKKITYVYSMLTWRDPAIYNIATSELAKNFSLDFVLLNPERNSALEQSLKEVGASTYFIHYKSKLSFPLACLKLWWHLLRQKPDIIHTHLLDANLVGLSAGFLAAIKHRIYTRHHSTQNYVLFRKALKYDRWSNLLATKVIATSQVVKEVLEKMDHVDAKKIHLIYHGIDIDRFSSPDPQTLQAVSQKYNPQSRKPVIGVFSRYIEWKGVQYILPAFAEVLKKYPNALLVLGNTFPSRFRQETLAPLFNELPKDSFVEIEHENHPECLYKAFDVFVHTPIDRLAEAFGLVYVEAQLSGTPCVFTKSGIAQEFVKNEESALVVDFKNSKQISEAIFKILQDKPLAERLGLAGQKLAQRFCYHKMIADLGEFYLAITR